MVTTYIYHYNTKKFSVLLSLRKQGNLSQSEIEESEQKAKEYYKPKPYIDNISFFIDPIPTMLLGKLYPKDHKTWFNGNLLYEHVVDVNKLEHNILYSLVESEDDSNIMDNTDSSTVFDISWHKNKYNRKLRTGETGYGLMELNKQIRKHQGTLSKKFIEARNRKYSDDPEVWSKYAAYVPHLMLYPSSGVIEVSSIEMIKIGKPR